MRPARAEKRPAAQGVQTAATAAEYVPAAQGDQSGELLMCAERDPATENVPAVQGAQLVRPVSAEYVPTAQSVHTEGLWLSCTCPQHT